MGTEEQNKEAVKTVEVKENTASVTTPVEGVIEVKDVVEKTLDNVNTEDTKEKVSDVVIVGNPDLWQLVCKASSEKEGWMKSTKAMIVTGGCVLQVTTQQKNPDGSYEIAEALTFVPGGRVYIDGDGNKYIN